MYDAWAYKYFIMIKMHMNLELPYTNLERHYTNPNSLLDNYKLLIQFYLAKEILMNLQRHFRCPDDPGWSMPYWPYIEPTAEQILARICFPRIAKPTFLD